MTAPDARAAGSAEQPGPRDPWLVGFSEGGLFESIPGCRARVVSTPEVEGVLRRSISGEGRSVGHVPVDLVDAVRPSRGTT